MSRHANGQLPPGAALLVEMHLHACRTCDSGMSSGEVPARALPRARSWRWAGFGVRIGQCGSQAGLGEHLYYIEARPGAALPEHAHQGIERTLVIRGAFVDGDERYAEGDLCERRDLAWHQPRATFDGPCLCLVATDAPLRLRGLARWLQPLWAV